MDWAGAVLGTDRIKLKSVSGDASFRSYYRFSHEDRSIILMDAPPEKENSSPFIDIAHRLQAAGLRAPHIFEFNLDLGFGLLEDFGDTLYRELIDEDSVEQLFPDLFDILERFARDVDPGGLPPYGDVALQFELDLFPNWYLARHHRMQMSEPASSIWAELSRRLIDSAHDQPQVFVHRDFHSCNLLQTANGPGIIDFQDAMNGPLSYDFVSLAWDRYISWPRTTLLAWMEELHGRFRLEMPLADWVRACDWMGLQRNLKIVGIFARLHYRDGKQGYLELIPRFYEYVLDVLPLYSEFDDFRLFLEHAECAP